MSNRGIIEREIVSTRIVDAPQDTVWEAWTDPTHLMKWWGPKGFTNTFQQCDVEPNGIWNFVMHSPDGTDYHNTNIFREVLKPNKIVFEHIEPIHTFQTTVTFEAQENKTLIVFRMLFESAEECQRVKSYVVEGNEQNFDRLEAELRTMI